jgi:hypothetical protein
LKEQAEAIAWLMWQRHRVKFATDLLYRSTFVGQDLEAYAREHGVDGVREYFADRARNNQAGQAQFDRKWREFERLLEETLIASSLPTFKMPKALDLIRNEMAPVRKAAETLIDIELRVFNTAYNADALQRLGRLMGELDVRIEKALARFFALKEHLRFSPKLLAPPAGRQRSDDKPSSEKSAADESLCTQQPTEGQALTQVEQVAGDNWSCD